MKFRLILRLCFSLFLFFQLSCKEGSAGSQRRAVSVNNPILDSLTTALQCISDSSLIPGFAAAIVSDEEVMYSKSFGYADAQKRIPFSTSSVNSIASVSKTFIGMAILQLVEQGKLTLDEPVNDILPYAIVNPYFPDIPITVRHLVTHTSSLEQEFDPEDVGESTIVLIDSFAITPETPAGFQKDIAYYKLGKFISIDDHIRNFTQPSGRWYTKDNFMRNAPGSRFNYTNLGALVAARIVEIRSGLSFDDYTQQYIFTPLQMKHTAWNYKSLKGSDFTTIYTVDDRKNPTRVLEHPRYEMTDYPVGGLKTNIDDLSIYLREIIRGYRGNGLLLKPDSYQVLLNPQLGDSCFVKRSEYLFDDQYNVGVFWAVSAPGYRLHNGGTIGVYSFVYFDPLTGIGVTAFCNLPHDDFGKIRDALHQYSVRLKSQ
ncbi:MAG: serine hydrolase domain-containing protein [Chitinophagaceae bacterium]